MSGFFRGCLVLFCLGLGGCDGTTSKDSDAITEHPGKKTYERFCASCHQAGVAGAPLFADAEQWQERLAKGREVLIKSTVDGIPPAMPKMGLCLSCDEQQIADAVDYMLQALTLAETTTSLSSQTQ